MNFDELFNKSIDIKAKFDGVDTTHSMRPMSNKEDLDFRRRTANIRLKGKRIVNDDDALQAPIWLYNQVCQKVIVENGSGPEEVPDHLAKIPDRLKLAVVNAYLNRVEVEEGEELGN